MNKLNAYITDIELFEGLCAVGFEVGDLRLIMIGLDLAEGIMIGAHVSVGVHPAQVAIYKGREVSGSDNVLVATIKSLEVGRIACRVVLVVGVYELESLILFSKYEAMGLSVGEEVKVCINPSVLSIVEVLDV